MARASKAKRYAQALFSLAAIEGKQESWLESLSGIEQQLSDPTAMLFFGEPRISSERKNDAAVRVAEGADPLVRNFVGLLVQKQAVGSLGAIVREYARILDESLGRVQATVTSAVEVSSAQRERLTDSLSGMLNKEVVLDINEDPGIIGGILVRVGDQVIDGSVRARLEGLRNRLERESLS